MFARIPDSEDAIGGYLSLEWARARPPHLEGATAFQSGRAAFLALLEAKRPRRVHVPWYLCDSMHEPLRQSGTEVVRYAIDEHFGIAVAPVLEVDDLLLLVNFFGLNGGQIAQALDTLPAHQVVVDNAHGFFDAPSPCLATLYSPRKFVGVPDGGYLHAPGVQTTSLAPDAAASLARSTHLFKRLALGAEAGYADYAAAEHTLDNQPAQGMSRLTEALLSRVDLASAKARRQRNFEWLHERLAPFNALQWSSSPGTVPLCYPLLPQRTGLREALAAARVYVPRYWPDLLAIGEALPAFERRLATDLLPLPIDQRYDTATLDRYLVTPLAAALGA